MELDEMKMLWTEMSQTMEKQKQLTDKLIIDMTQQKFHNRMRSISVPETIGDTICFAIALILLLNFGKLDSFYLQAAGVFAIGFYVIVPILSLTAIRKMRRINLSENNYKQTLLEFTKAKQQFLLVQHVGIALRFILVIVSVPLAGKLMSDKDIFFNSSFWYWYIPIGFIALFFFARWGYRCYSNITTNAGTLLKELDA